VKLLDLAKDSVMQNDKESDANYDADTDSITETNLTSTPPVPTLD
jgi:hypothetical protein